MQEFIEDGWEHSQNQDIVIDGEIQSVRYRGDKGLSILQAKHHSLQPDMVSGWRPKLPSCPLPISYHNVYVDALLGHLAKDDTYSVAYIGPRYVNSVQINQKYSYTWKYRQRYSLNLAIIQQAVRKVGTSQPSPKFLHQSSPSTYTFNSQFQSGNLDLSIRVKKNEYDCFIRSDTNTKGHTNWYYFSINNNQQIGPIKINICNMTKCRNLYSKGMKPYVKVQGKGQGKGYWGQDGCKDVVFVQRYCRYGFEKKTYQLQFIYDFTEPNQTVYFAYSVPYTYSDLQNFIKQIKQSHQKLVSSRRLCQSLGGLQLPLLTITNQDNQYQDSQNSPDNETQQTQPSSQNPKKKAVLITSRIHPGQSNSSHMMQGFIRQLLKDTESSNILRSMFVFYIVPMLNPDGVVVGNFRTSYSGKDLNRQFNGLNKWIFPEITALSEFCQNMKKSAFKGIQFYFDFHGHSAKKNLFCYGPQHPTTKTHFFKCRALAKIIQKISPIFSYRKSIFTISQQKKNTGRAYMLRNMKIPMTFTFQISNGLYEDQKKNDVFLDRNILLKTGEIIVKGLYRYAQLEMRIPRKYVKAKVDTGKFKKRPLNSAGASRRGDTLKKRSQNQSSQGLRQKPKTPQKPPLSHSLQKPNKHLESNNQFLQLMKQIKQEQLEHQQQPVQIQGGSDSESSDDDLDKEESNALFTQIMKRNNQSSYNFVIRERDGMVKKKIGKIGKIGYKKKDNQEDEENGLRDVIENRKIKSNRIIEMSRPPIASIKNIKRGVSMEYEKVVLAQKNFTMLL